MDFIINNWPWFMAVIGWPIIGLLCATIPSNTGNKYLDFLMRVLNYIAMNFGHASNQSTTATKS
jgi:hypothetical protein